MAQPRSGAQAWLDDEGRAYELPAAGRFLYVYGDGRWHFAGLGAFRCAGCGATVRQADDGGRCAACPLCGARKP